MFFARVARWLSGSAIEAACHVTWPAETDYVPAMRRLVKNERVYPLVNKHSY